MQSCAARTYRLQIAHSNTAYIFLILRSANLTLFPTYGNIPGSLLQKSQQDKVCCHPHYAERIIQTTCLKSLLHNSLLSSPLLYGSHSIALRINIILTSHKPMNTILQDPLQRKSSRKLELPSTTKGLSTKGCICRIPSKLFCRVKIIQTR
jgi:hypothetical protein